MDLNCVDLTNGTYLEIPKNNVLYIYKGTKYQLLVRTIQPIELEWEMKGSVNAASNFLKQFGFVRLDTNVVANLDRVISRSRKKMFGKYEARFTDGSKISVSRTAYYLYLMHLPLH